MKRDALFFVLGLLAAALISVYNAVKPRMPSVLAPVSDDLAKVQKELLDCQKISVFKPKAKKKLNLPDTVKLDPTKHVVAASPVPPSDHQQTMTAVYDSDTGNVDMFLRQDPLPWVAFNRRSELGLAYGVRDNGGGAVWRADGKISIAQVKAVSFGPVGAVDTSGGWFLGVGGWARW